MNPKTVTKWKKRAFVTDTPMGPWLSKEEEALVVAFRRHTCCCTMIASTRSRPRSHVSPVPVCIGCLSAMTLAETSR